MTTDFDDDDFVKLRNYKYTAYGEFYRYYPKSIADKINSDNKKFSTACNSFLKKNPQETIQTFAAMWFSGMVKTALEIK